MATPRRPPPHRRKRDPLRRQILGAYKPPPVPREAVHQFHPSGVRDLLGRRVCVTCDNVEQSRVHDVPQPPEHVAEADERKGG
jgi:hypothetical protein